MLPTEFANDLTLLAMCVVRIGIPIAITLALGYWLEKKLRSPEESTVHPVVKNELGRRRAAKFFELHCWDLKGCDTTRRAECAAFQHPDLPCWLALQVEGDKLREECFTCELYKSEEIAA